MSVVFSTDEIDCHNITEILLKLALNTLALTLNPCSLLCFKTLFVLYLGHCISYNTMAKDIRQTKVLKHNKEQDIQYNDQRYKTNKVLKHNKEQDIQYNGQDIRQTKI
jgi:hypothetical protein